MKLEFDRRLVVIAVLLAFGIGSIGPVAAQSWPPEIKNLQHFPEGTELRELMGAMRGFAMGLGVRCQYCHIGEEGQPLATFDFASDEKETKRKARIMLAMTDAINQVHLAKLDGEPADLLRVQCVTCHRGVARPEQLESILIAAGESDAAEVVVAKYRELRDEHLGSGSYDFSEGTLIRAAEALSANKPETAVALLNESLGHAPESSWALGTLAGVEARRGNPEAAVEALEKILDLDPEYERVRRQLEELSQPEAPQAPGEADS